MTGITCVPYDTPRIRNESWGLQLMKHSDCYIIAIVLAMGLGCGTSEAPIPVGQAATFSGINLKVAAFGDASLIPALNAQRGEWEATRKTTAIVTTESINADSLTGIDVIVFPGDRLGELVDLGALAILPDALVRPIPSSSSSEISGTPKPLTSETLSDDPLKFDDVLTGFKDFVTKYGNDRMGLPLGSSALVLVINQGLLEQAKVGLRGPKTWKDLDTLATALHAGEIAGIALALGDDPEGVGNTIFLARAAALGQHKDQFSFLFDADTMTPRIASPPFVEALQGLVELGKTGPAGALNFDANAARAAFRTGKVGLLIDRAERAETWAGGFPIVVAHLPGSERVYDPASKSWETVKPLNNPTYLPTGGGWLVGIAASTQGKRRDAALDFASYLATPEIASRVRTMKASPMLPARNTQLTGGLPDPKSSAGVDSRAWSEAVASTLTAGRIIPGLRIPDASGYLADLSKARVSATHGEPVQAALETAAKAWDDRSLQLGRDRQLWHYRRSLNRLATKPQPPERPTRTP